MAGLILEYLERPLQEFLVGCPSEEVCDFEFFFGSSSKFSYMKTVFESNLVYVIYNIDDKSHFIFV